VAVLLVSISLAFGAGEMALRYWDPEWRIFFPPICFRPDLFQQVPWGYRLWPSRVFEHRYPPKGPNVIKVVSNSDGFRSAREFGDTDPRQRVVVLGDSLVFGEGVDQSERFTEVMEQASPHWRIDNLGMIGYGPDLMLRAFEAVGMWAKPDVVVVCLYTDDFRRVALYYAGVGFPIPRFVLRNGELTTVDYPEPHIWERTRFFQGILYLYWRYTPATFDLNQAILDRFADRARRGPFELAVVFLPGMQAFPDDRRRRTWLEDYSVRRGLPYLDLSDALHEGGGSALYLPNDSHWNAEGHRVVARHVGEFIGRISGSSARARDTSSPARRSDPRVSAGTP
jgi:hypothetical protein